MDILGVNPGHHDASACLLRDGSIVAFAEEERFSRNKRSPGQRPRNAVKFCLDAAGITLDDVDYLATTWIEGRSTYTAPPGPKREITFSVRLDRDSDYPVSAPLRELFEDSFAYQRFPPVGYVSHHLAHAASAYRCSSFDEAAILVVDGYGDRVATTLAWGSRDAIDVIAQFPIAMSLGQFYASVTQHLGFGDGGEGKTMGLAPYGRPSIAFDEIVWDERGYGIDLGLTGDLWDPAVTGGAAVAKAWQDLLRRRHGERRGIATFMGAIEAGQHRYRHDIDLAASAQLVLETVLCHLAGLVLRETGSRNLVLAGGVGMNCSANGRLRRLPGVDQLFVQPIANDAGTSIGAALELYAQLGHTGRAGLEHLALGPGYADGEIHRMLREFGLRFTVSDDLPARVASLLAEDATVGWFQGRMEGGPRALGHRSILASPGSSTAAVRVNDLKHRARWRPLAPSLRAERAGLVLEELRQAPYMIQSDAVRPEVRERLPAVVHVDGSARPQIVDKGVDPLFSELLRKFEGLTGLPALLNTSFNNEREPIVCSPLDALRTFYTTGLDALAMGPFLLTKVG